MQAVDYYNELFTLVYGDSVITEDRIQKAIAQFVRSIQSFDSRYDEGDKQDFANFIESEKRGMELFTTPPLGASRRGLDCFHCHRPPAFDIKMRETTGSSGWPISPVKLIFPMDLTENPL